MSLFIDSGDLDEVREAVSWGIVDGVTTNPTLLREAAERRGVKGLRDYLVELLKAAGRGRPVSLEVMSTKAEDMVREGLRLYDDLNPIAGNVVIKVPVTTKGVEQGELEGIKAIKALSEVGVPVNATLIMTPSQAYLAAKAGATYVSLFLGRIDDFVRSQLGIKYSKWDYFNYRSVRAALQGGLAAPARSPGEALANPVLSALNVNWGLLSGVEVLRSVRAIFRSQGFRAKVIAASMRHPRQVEEALEAGADIVTVPYHVIKAMVVHPKSEEGIRVFVDDARAANYGELFR